MVFWCSDVSPRSLSVQAEKEVTDVMFQQAAYLFPENTPPTKENYLYRSIFVKHFPQHSASQTVKGGYFLCVVFLSFRSCFVAVRGLLGIDSIDSWYISVPFCTFLCIFLVCSFLTF